MPKNKDEHHLHGKGKQLPESFVPITGYLGNVTRISRIRGNGKKKGKNGCDCREDNGNGKGHGKDKVKKAAVFVEDGHDTPLSKYRNGWVTLRTLGDNPRHPYDIAIVIVTGLTS